MLEKIFKCYANKNYYSSHWINALYFRPAMYCMLWLWAAWSPSATLLVANMSCVAKCSSWNHMWSHMGATTTCGHMWHQQPPVVAAASCGYRSGSDMRCIEWSAATWELAEPSADWSPPTHPSSYWQLCRLLIIEIIITLGSNIFIKLDQTLLCE